MDELDLGTDLDYKDLGDNARKNDCTDFLKSPMNDVKNCLGPQLVRPGRPGAVSDCFGSFPLPRIPKRKQTDTKDQIKQDPEIIFGFEPQLISFGRNKSEFISVWCEPSLIIKVTKQVVKWISDPLGMQTGIILTSRPKSFCDIDGVWIGKPFIIWNELQRCSKLKEIKFVVLCEIDELLPDSIEALIRIFKYLQIDQCKIIQVYSYLNSSSKLVTTTLAGDLKTREIRVHESNTIDDLNVDFGLLLKTRSNEIEMSDLIDYLNKFGLATRNYSNVRILVVSQNVKQRDLILDHLKRSKITHLKISAEADLTVPTYTSASFDTVIHMNQDVQIHRQLRKITNGMIISLISDEYYLARLRALYPKTFPKRINDYELIDRIKKQNEMLQLLKNCPINITAESA